MRFELANFNRNIPDQLLLDDLLSVHSELKRLEAAK